MSTLLEQLEQSVRDMEQAARDRQEYLTEHSANIDAMLETLPQDKIIRVCMDASCVDVSISGDFETLKAVFHAFRTAGYEFDSRPDEKTMNYSAFLYCDEKPTFWLSFSSTVCKRVKVGTEMKELDIYEVVCE